VPLSVAEVDRGTVRTVLPLLPRALVAVAAGRDAGRTGTQKPGARIRIAIRCRPLTFCPQSSLAASLAAPFLRSGSNRKAAFFDGDFAGYEDWRRSTLGEAATRPHRITCRELTT